MEKRYQPKKLGNKNPIPKTIGRERTEHGTRLSHRIECSRCSKTDYVAIKSHKSANRLCRACAEKYISTYEQGRRIEESKVSINCQQCNKEFLVKESVASEKDELLCLDCLRGFEVWRGRAGVTNKTKLITKTSSNTIIRKRIYEPV